LKTHLISAEDVPYIWDDVAPMLHRVKEHSEGELEIDDFLDHLTMGGMQLWIATENKEIIMSAVTQIISYPQKKILRVIALAGENFKEVHDNCINMVEAFAIKHQCSSLELWGRKGWKKMLPDWNSNYIVYTKDLKERMH
jgi:hypothetical protein